MPPTRTQSGYPHTDPGCASPRPPWAVPEDLFTVLCTGCGQCVEDCPRWLLKRDATGRPRVDFSGGECSFCGECVDACGRGALTRVLRGRSWGPWTLKAVVGSTCLVGQGVLCRVCGEQCAAAAIVFHAGGARPQVDTHRCNGCGACVRSCPARSVALYDDSTHSV
jgi:ferredoxin-type protein NapF